mmetsp:Transcript_29040/g.47970  ORF Transcript_29040/g.47970 Transcript_29040/m.47970 type:complete len:559 (+) Transcript_29040:59-1735(+)
MSFLCGCSKVEQQVTDVHDEQFNKHEAGHQLKRGMGSSSRRSVYFDASQGNLTALDDNDLYFFDAQTDEDSLEDLYVAITTDYVKPPPRRMSILVPESLLSSRTLIPKHLKDHQDEAVSPPSVTTNDQAAKPPQQQHGAVIARQCLENPSIKIVERGYPGVLTPEEVTECQRFYKEIKQRNGVHQEIVYSCSDVELEPYTLCRFVRATKFDTDKMLARLEDEAFAERWREAKRADFYPDLEQSLNCSISTLFSQYHFLYCGNAKNGCPVSYMKTDSINTEGLLCLMTVEDTQKFFWHQFVHVFKPLLHKALAKDSNFVRCEAVAVLDLKGASSSQLNADATEVIKHMTGIADYFPETLHCMIIINAASWFSMAWTIIKRFIDPRTARKIEVYSNAEKGKRRLMELIDANQLPSNFGGTGLSTHEEIQGRGKSSVDSRTARQIVKLIHLKKGSDVSRCELKLEHDEVMKIKVYTRSVCTASFSITNNEGQSFVKGNFVDKGDTECTPPRPCCTELASNVKGTVVVEASKMEAISKGSKKKTPPLPMGYFLVVADIEKAA